MKLISPGSRASILTALALVAALTGCVSLPDIRTVRQLPGFSANRLTSKDFVYDPGLRAYRIRKGGKDSDMDGWPVARNGMGRKIQSESELDRYLETVNRPSVGGGTKTAVYTFSILYSPIYLIEDLIGYILSIPLLPARYIIKKEDRTATERNYNEGRALFDSGDYAESLRRLENSPSSLTDMSVESDINYWRGRAYEETGERADARSAYLSFLRISERTVPEYFKNKRAHDPPWSEKADDAEKRIYALGSSP